MIATGSRDGFTRLWAGRGRLLAKLAQEAPVTGVVFGRGATRLATTGADGKGRLWKIPQGRLLRVLSGHADSIVQVAFSPNGRYLATASRDTTARLWDGRAGKQLRVLEGDDTAITSIAFNRTGGLLVTTSQGGEARIWRVQAGGAARRLQVLQHHLAVADAAFSADSRWLVTAGAPRAHVWGVSTGRELFSPRGHLGPIRTVAFSPRGWRILSAGRDGTVRTYRCEVCADLRGLRALGKQRLDRLDARH
jgi:WD40 repeat protein